MLGTYDKWKMKGQISSNIILIGVVTLLVLVVLVVLLYYSNITVQSVDFEQIIIEPGISEINIIKDWDYLPKGNCSNGTLYETYGDSTCSVRCGVDSDLPADLPFNYELELDVAEDQGMFPLYIVIENSSCDVSCRGFYSGLVCMPSLEVLD